MGGIVTGEGGNEGDSDWREGVMRGPPRFTYLPPLYITQYGSTVYIGIAMGGPAL